MDNQPVELTQKIIELETKVKKLEFSGMIITGLVMIVYILCR
jgi:hypothetical protein